MRVNRPHFIKLSASTMVVLTHSIMVSVAAIRMHMFMALIHPASKVAIKGMIDGTVDCKLAAGHHPKRCREGSGQNATCKGETK